MSIYLMSNRYVFIVHAILLGLPSNWKTDLKYSIFLEFFSFRSIKHLSVYNQVSVNFAFSSTTLWVSSTIFWIVQVISFIPCMKCHYVYCWYSCRSCFSNHLLDFVKCKVLLFKLSVLASYDIFLSPRQLLLWVFHIRIKTTNLGKGIT